MKPSRQLIDQVTKSNRKVLGTLHPEARRPVSKLISAAANKGLLVKLTSGTRTFTRQAELYRLYKSKDPRQPYPAAPPGGSWHNFGLAVDAIILDASGKRVHALDSQLGKIAKSMGFIWGGDFKKNDPRSL